MAFIEEASDIGRQNRQKLRIFNDSETHWCRDSHFSTFRSKIKRRRRYDFSKGTISAILNRSRSDLSTSERRSCADQSFASPINLHLLIIKNHPEFKSIQSISHVQSSSTPKVIII